MSLATAEGGRFALPAADRDRLRRRIAVAAGGAGRGGAGRAPRGRAGRALPAVTLPVPADVDPTATVAASRRPADDWFAFEQPDRDRAALATLGVAARLEGAGPGRFAAVAAAWRQLVAGAASDDPGGPRGAGPVAVGGFAFARDGGEAPHWAR